MVRMTAQVQSYRDKLQLKIEEITGVDEAPDEELFVPAARRKPEEMAEELHAILRGVTNPHLKKLLHHFFKRGELLQRFQEAPAAKAIHHAYRGGLLEHCLSMAKVANFLAAHYPGVDRSLLLAGVLLHDIGKVAELIMTSGVIEYSDAGRLKGHLVIGSELVAEAAAKIVDFPPELLVQVQHLILSHHGKQEFGSPTVPMTIEALLLSFIDDLDAKMNLAEQLRHKQDGSELAWSEYQRSLERYLFLGGLPKEEIRAEEGGDTAGRQPKLF
jgi:3'-5' exoribonuclease